MALARFIYKYRRSILAILLWCFAILSFLQWQQQKLKHQMRKNAMRKLPTDHDYGSGDVGIDPGLDILLNPDSKVFTLSSGFDFFNKF